MNIQKIKKWESEHLLYNELMTFSHFEREIIIIEASLNVYNSSIYYTYIYIYSYMLNGNTKLVEMREINTLTLD